LIAEIGLIAEGLFIVQTDIYISILVTVSVIRVHMILSAAVKSGAADFIEHLA